MSNRPYSYLHDGPKPHVYPHWRYGALLRLIDRVLARFLEWRGYATVPPPKPESGRRMFTVECGEGKAPVVWCNGECLSEKPDW